MHIYHTPYLGPISLSWTHLYLYHILNLATHTYIYTWICYIQQSPQLAGPPIFIGDYFLFKQLSKEPFQKVASVLLISISIII